MKVRPCDITTARVGVARVHRHRATPPPGALAAWEVVDATGWPRGGALVGRPASRHLQAQGWIEVTRCAVEEGVPNACSALYGAAARWARKRGTPITTYTLQEEPGASLRGAGWIVVGEVGAHTGAGWGSRARRAATDRRPKLRWSPAWAIELAAQLQEGT